MAAGEGSSGLTLEDKIDHSSALKEEGNALFKQKDLKKAMKKYHTSLMYVRGLVDRPSLLQHTPSAEMANEEQKERIHQIEFSIYNNLAGSHECVRMEISLVPGGMLSVYLRLLMSLRTPGNYQANYLVFSL